MDRTELHKVCFKKIGNKIGKDPMEKAEVTMLIRSRCRKYVEDYGMGLAVLESLRRYSPDGKTNEDGTIVDVSGTNWRLSVKILGCAQTKQLGNI